MNVMEFEHVTKNYGRHQGLFDVTFHVKKGEAVGFLGPNGSGKTTTIRHFMGFMKPDRGYVRILGMDCFQDASLIQQKLGYLPGEIAFIDDMTGIEFIQFIAEMKKIKNLQKAYELIEFLELDVQKNMKKMSKGMKQKVALVIAFMQEAPLLILDEPTSGLDPLMQKKFIQLIQQAKREGKTIFMSSHIFGEVEKICDRAIMIKEGKIVANMSMDDLKKSHLKHYEVTFEDQKEAIDFAEKCHGECHGCVVSCFLKEDVHDILKSLLNYHIVDLNIRPQSLEELFLHYYGGE